MEKKKQLSEVQRFALTAANASVLIAQDKRRGIAVAIAEELGISKEELTKWKFAEDFSYIESPKIPDKNKS